jgi:hypothetical protein
MNIFTTDHPMASQSSWFDMKQHPGLSFVCSSFILALFLTPFVLFRLLFWATSDIGAESNPFPEPWLTLGGGLVVAFGVSFICACPIILAYRFLARHWRKKRYAA